jgi:D-aminopeptidase
MPTAAIPKARARDLGIPLHGIPGAWNAITDVPGVRVGYTTVRTTAEDTGNPICTGITAIQTRPPTEGPIPVWAGYFSLNGNGEMTGTHWIGDAGWFLGPICLTNTHSVGLAHHVVVRWMIDHYPDHFRRHHAWAMPVIAETYDGVVNDICAQYLQPHHVLAALHGAVSGPIAEGNVGGGAGMQTYDFKGGTGTSSRRVSIGDNACTVGALVQSNFGTREDLVVAGVPIGRLYSDDRIEFDHPIGEMGSIIVVLATDLPLSPSQLTRLAKRATLGLGRTGTRGGHYSGDLFLAFSTANPVPQPALGEAQPAVYTAHFLHDAALDAVYGAAVEAVEEAILNALVAAQTVPTYKPPGQYLRAIDHDRLVALLKQHDRWAEPGSARR